MASSEFAYFENAVRTKLWWSRICRNHGGIMRENLTSMTVVCGVTNIMEGVYHISSARQASIRESIVMRKSENDLETSGVRSYRTIALGLICWRIIVCKISVPYLVDSERLRRCAYDSSINAL